MLIERRVVSDVNDSKQSFINFKQSTPEVKWNPTGKEGCCRKKSILQKHITALPVCVQQWTAEPMRQKRHSGQQGGSEAMVTAGNFSHWQEFMDPPGKNTVDINSISNQFNQLTCIQTKKRKRKRCEAHLEAQLLWRLRQEHHKLKLSNLVRSNLKIKSKKC